MSRAPLAALPGGEVPALRRAVDAEHAAIYGYGVVGARIGREDKGAARAAYDAHLFRRDQLAALLRDRGVSPPAAAPAYVLPGRIGSPAQARALATRIEAGVAATYADLVAASGGALRELAAGALADAAVREALWRRASTAFPGLPERKG